MQIIVLDTTTKSFEMVLGEAATTQLPFVTAWIDSTATDVTEGETDGTSNSTTAVTVAAAPAASTRRIIKDISVYNADNISHTLTLRVNNNSTTRIVWTGTLASGASFYLSRVLSAGGGSPLTTQGDMFIFDTGNTRLAKGTALQQLRMNSGATLPEWFTPTAAAATWTSFSGAYASGTTITVSGTDVTGVMKKGVILKWLSSADVFKTGIVVSSTFSTDTTITVVGSTVASGDKTFYYGPFASRQTFIIAGTFPSAATTDLSKTWYNEDAIYVISADLVVKTAGSGTGSTVVDINDDGTTMFTTKPTLTTTGTTDRDNVSDNPTTAVAQYSAITIDVDSVTATTAPVDGYIDLFYYPVSLTSRT